jgi:hypothetical protein
VNIMNQQRTNGFVRDITIGALGALLATLITWVVTLAAPAVFIKGLGGVTQAEFIAFKTDVDARFDLIGKGGAANIVTRDEFNGHETRLLKLEAPKPDSGVSITGLATQEQVDLIANKVNELENRPTVDMASFNDMKSVVDDIVQQLVKITSKTQYIQENPANDGATRIGAGAFTFVFNSSDGRVSVHSGGSVTRLWDDVNHP